MKAIPFDVPGLTDIIDYPSDQDYTFFEIRDQNVDLSYDDCVELAQVAKEKGIELIYVFNKNPLDTAYFAAFNKAIANVSVFQGPAILRALASKTEFESDTVRKGWSTGELKKISSVADSCTEICWRKNIRFVFENSNEAFFGDGMSYYGLADLLNNTKQAGLQLDIANLFRNTARAANDPQKVLDFLPSLGGRWVEAHLKTVVGGEAQTVLTDNPIPFREIFEAMNDQGVIYAAIELTAVENKQKRIDNHAKSIQFLRDNGLLN
jgi:sugar phosphate isomerase/epimerase